MTWSSTAFTLAFLLMGWCGQRDANAQQPSEHDDSAVTASPIEGPDGLKDTPEKLTWQDVSPGWNQPGQKLLLTGTIFQPDGKTPAKDVVLYYYHTNAEGRYVHKPEEPRSMKPNELGQTHGYLRGWVKTGADGKYEIRTIRPAVYPTRDAPAHIHATIKEPGIAEYYIDEFVFDDDPLLTTRERLRTEKRCGSGVLRLVRKDDLVIGERNIYLGLNVPGHAGTAGHGPKSGPHIGEDLVSFTPTHAWGPDKGTRACPVCKYGWYHGIMYFVGRNLNWTDVRAWLTFLESESGRRKDKLKVYMIYGNEEGFSKEARQRELETLGRELGLERVALTYVPSLTDKESDLALNRIDPSVASTMIVYRRSRVIDKAVGLAPLPENFEWIKRRLDETGSGYFNMAK
jgi:protocatechuate 3,4-dioxygenase, beta subunit